MAADEPYEEFLTRFSQSRDQVARLYELLVDDVDAQALYLALTCTWV